MPSSNEREEFAADDAGMINMRYSGLVEEKSPKSKQQKNGNG